MKKSLFILGASAAALFAAPGAIAQDAVVVEEESVVVT